MLSKWNKRAMDSSDYVNYVRIIWLLWLFSSGQSVIHEYVVPPLTKYTTHTHTPPPPPTTSTHNKRPVLGRTIPVQKREQYQSEPHYSHTRVLLGPYLLHNSILRPDKNHTSILLKLGPNKDHTRAKQGPY